LTVISGVRADRYQGAGSDKKQTRRHPDPGRPALASNERGSRPARIPCRSGFSRDARGRLTVIFGVRADRDQGAGSDKKQTRRHPDPGRPGLASNERGFRPAPTARTEFVGHPLRQ